MAVPLIVIAGGIMFFIGRNKGRKEITHQDIISASQEIMKNKIHRMEMDDSGKEIESLKENIQRLKTKNTGLKDEIKKLKDVFAKLEKGNLALKKAAETGQKKTPKTQPEEKADAEKILAEFKKIAKSGLAAFASPETQKLVEKIKKLGDKGIEMLGEILLNDPSANSKFLAAAIFEKLKDTKAIQYLDEALKNDESDLVRRMAAHALAFMDNSETAPILERVMNEDKDWGVRMSSAFGLGKLGKKEGIDYLLKAYKESKVPIEKIAAFQSLALICDKSTAHVFRKILKKEKIEFGYKLAAIGVLEKMMDNDCLRDLEDIINGNDEESVKEAAKKAYNKISGQEIYE
jgi:regulator of replication initiation timing